MNFIPCFKFSFLSAIAHMSPAKQEESDDNLSDVAGSDLALSEDESGAKSSGDGSHSSSARRPCLLVLWFV